MNRNMVVVKAPYRVSMFGGGTDFPDFFIEHGGAVLSMAIDKGVTVVASRRWDTAVRVVYSKTEFVEDYRELEHDLIRAAMAVTGVTSGVEIVTIGDIPGGGSGLGSSSTVTVGVIHALSRLAGNVMDAGQLLEAANAVELGILKRPMGVQDQAASAYGGLRLYEFDRDGTHPQAGFYWPETLQNRLLLFFTGITRQNGGVLAQQRAKIGQNTAILQEQAELAREAWKTLRAGNVWALGPMLHEAWQLKKNYHDTVSLPEIDAMYDEARRAGATGGKVCGAGAGGFLLLFCPDAETRTAVRQALRNYKELEFGVAGGSEVIYER